MTMACEGFGKQLDFDSAQSVPSIENPDVIRLMIGFLHATTFAVQQVQVP